MDGVLGVRTRTTGWKAQTNPLSYGGPNVRLVLILRRAKLFNEVYFETDNN